MMANMIDEKRMVMILVAMVAIRRQRFQRWYFLSSSLLLGIAVGFSGISVMVVSTRGFKAGSVDGMGEEVYLMSECIESRSRRLEGMPAEGGHALL